MQALGGKDMGFDQPVDRLEGGGAGADMVGQGRQDEIDAFPNVFSPAPQRCLRRWQISRCQSHRRRGREGARHGNGHGARDDHDAILADRSACSKIIRNSLSHGWRIDIRNPADVPAAWRGLIPRRGDADSSHLGQARAAPERFQGVMRQHLRPLLGGSGNPVLSNIFPTIRPLEADFHPGRKGSKTSLIHHYRPNFDNGPRGPLDPTQDHLLRSPKCLR